MRRVLVIVVALAGLTASAAAIWLHDRRLGAGFVNRVVDPLLVGHGLAGAGASEVGTLEHIGRRTGTRRLTPVHPVPTPTGFRVVVPLAERSEWARNVIAAGHCRLQLHGIVHELDEPVLLDAAQMPELTAPVRWLAARLGFRYLLLHTFGQHPGSLSEPAVEAAPREPSVEVEGPLTAAPALEASSA